MTISRRQALAGSAASAAALATGVFRPAIAQSEPIRIGYLPALTGPSSSTGIGINRGTELAVKEINAAGGIKGRQLELIVRDTQSDPTKAVNASTELTRRHKVHVMWGPLNSGEALAATPLIARDNVPQIHPCWVDGLTDPKKWPLAFRNGPTNQQIGAAANHYVVNIVKAKKVAVVSDTTGYGTASLNAYVPMLKTMGAEVVYEGTIDASNPDVKPEMLRMQSGGAQAIMPWSVNAGFLSRLINTRAEMNWDVPIVGQTTLGSGQTKALLKKPEYWEKVYPNNFRNCSYDSAEQAAAAHGRVRRPVAQGQHRYVGYAAVVDRARLRRAAADRRCDQGRRHRAGSDRRLLEQGLQMAWRLRHHHLDTRTARWLPERRDHHVPGQFAEGRRLHARAWLYRLDRCWSRSSPTAWHWEPSTH